MTGPALTLRRIASGLKRRIFSRLGPSKSISYPYVVSLTELVEDGCKFEITTEIESYRVEMYGEEKEFTALVLHALQPGSVLYDLGANVGLVTVHAAHKCARVVAFEPDPGYRARLERNLQINSLANVQVIDWAVSDHQGEARLFVDNDQGLARFSPILTDWPGRPVKKTVHIDSIDNALSQEMFPWPDVLKVDIEGAEMSALRGMDRLLASERAPTIFIEVHPEFLPAFGSSAGEVMNYLEVLGYEIEYMSERNRQVHYMLKKRARTVNELGRGTNQ